MKTVLRMSFLAFLLMGLLACLEVTPDVTEIELETGARQVFTAVSDVDEVLLEWTLDDKMVGTGGEYTFRARNTGTAPEVHTLTVSELFEHGGSTPDSHTWQITVLPYLPWCYMDEDLDGFGDRDNGIQSLEPPDNCVDIALARDCDDENEDIHPQALDIEDGLDNNCNGFVDEQVLLHVYSDGWGNLLETLEMDEQGEITITVDEEYPYSGEQPSYFIYASQPGYYTSYIYCDYGDTIDVTLDPIDPGLFNGTIFITQDYFGPTYLSNTRVRVYQDGRQVQSFTTDKAGRFAIDIPAGTYTIQFEDMDGYDVYEEPLVVSGSYADMKIPAHMQADKPNIYIYPEASLDLSVGVSFPEGGHVSKSIPDYGSGWQVTVEPDGMIDGEFRYLFYESIQPDLCQYHSGWVVATQELSAFFRENMALSGFNQAEIDDFIEYWIPRLTDAPFYAVYPQYTDEMNTMSILEFSVQPDNLLRLIYAVKGVDADDLNIAEPVIPYFEREGFTVVEWGVIQK